MSVADISSDVPFNNGIKVKRINISSPPVLNTGNSNVLAWNASTGNVEYNNNINGGDVSNAANLGGGTPVFHTKNGSILEFNTIATNPAQGFVVDPPPLLGGQIVINNNFLDQDVKTTAFPSFGRVSVNDPIGTNGTLILQDGGTSTFSTILSPTQTADRTIALPDKNGTIVLDQSPFILNGDVLLGVVTTPKLYTYTASCNTTANASFNVFQFVPPNTVDSQSIILNLEACFYNKVALESAYVKKVYTFTYIPGVSFNIAFTDVSIIDRPVATNYLSQAIGNIGPDEIRIFVQPNNTDSTDVLLNFTFLCKSM